MTDRVRAIGPALALLVRVLIGAKPPGWNWQLPRAITPPAVPADNPMSATKVELGSRLFYDADLSADGTMACAGCHEQRRGFADGNRTRPGVTGEPGRRNVPGLANVAWYSPPTFADPAQKTLEAQVSVPVLGVHPVEMGMAGREAEIAARLGRDPCYRTMFAAAFPEDGGRIDMVHVARALASFERTLVSFDSAYDRGQLTEQMRAGQAVFSRACATCHKPPHFTDLRYHRLAPRDPVAADAGLGDHTARAGDRGKFRTPSLRNVALTAPYWHDGTAATLPEAIRRHGIVVATGDSDALTAYLGALADTAFTTDPRHALPATACGRPL